MSKSTVLTLVGSLRAESTNQKLAEAIQLNAPEQVDVVIHESLGNIPFYNEDIDVEGQVPAAAAALRAAANEADALLLVTPEHNGTVPAALKNAIDWLSRPFGAGALSGKPTAVVGTAFGQFGGVWAQDEARKAVGIAGARGPRGRQAGRSRLHGPLRRSCTRRTTPRLLSRSRASSTPSPCQDSSPQRKATGWHPAIRQLSPGIRRGVRGLSPPEMPPATAGGIFASPFRDRVLTHNRYRSAHIHGPQRHRRNVDARRHMRELEVRCVHDGHAWDPGRPRRRRAALMLPLWLGSCSRRRLRSLRKQRRPGGRPPPSNRRSHCHRPLAPRPPDPHAHEFRPLRLLQLEPEQKPQRRTAASADGGSTATVDSSAGEKLYQQNLFGSCPGWGWRGSSPGAAAAAPRRQLHGGQRRHCPGRCPEGRAWVSTWRWTTAAVPVSQLSCRWTAWWGVFHRSTPRRPEPLRTSL